MTNHTKGTGNVFADVGASDAEDKKRRAELIDKLKRAADYEDKNGYGGDLYRAAADEIARLSGFIK